MLKKFYYILIILFGLNYTANSQYNLDIGLSLGGSGYLGDIGGTEFNAKKYLGDLLINQTNASAGGFIRYKLNQKWAINSSLNYIRLAGDDANTKEGPRNWRNLRFRNNIFEIASRAEFIVYQISDLGGSGRYNTSLNLFLHAGFSLFYHNPKGSKDEFNWVSLRPLKTEGYKYKSIGFATPLGAGVTITHNRYSRYGLVLNYRQTFTDYLDDVSTNFIDPSNLSSDAAELANQFNGPDEELVNYEAGTIRGNPKNKDVFFTLSLTYSKYIIANNRYYRAPRRTNSFYRSKKFKKSKFNRGRSNKKIRSKF